MDLVYNLVDFFFMNNNEEEILSYIKRKKNKIIFDVGSFKGKFTEKILKLDKYKSNSKFYLFDPNPNGLNYITNLKKKNKNVRYSCVGLDNKIKKKKFHLNKFFEASGSSFQTILKNDKMWNSSRRKVLNIFNIFNKKSLKNFKDIIVKTNTIDNFCKEEKINTIDLLKIDAEGHEEYILKGSGKLLDKKKINVIYVEVLSEKKSFYLKKKKIMNFLKKKNFIFIKEYPINSVSVLSNLKSSDLLFVNRDYRCK